MTEPGFAASDLPVFGIYEKALKPQPLRDMFRDAAKAGYQSLELSIDCTDERLSRLDWSWREACRVRQEAAEEGMQILTMCLDISDSRWAVPIRRRCGPEWRLWRRRSG